MTHVLFRCPTTGLKVQHWVDDNVSPSEAKTYETVNCPACAKLHFVNKVTGRTLGERKE